MKKMPIYEIFKINTTRLARNNYTLDLTYEQGVINAEVVGLSSSQTLRKIREMCDYDDNDLFIHEYMSIQVDSKAHYKHIKKNGITINGHKFKRFGCSAGNARSEIVFMIREEIYDAMNEIMLCGVKPFKQVPAKFNAYYTLNSSSTYPIREPRVVVLPDFEETLNHRFDWIHEDGTIENKLMDIDGYPPFDGQGIVRIEFAEKMAEDIELDYVPSGFVVRNTYVKGSVFTMDFDKFAKEVAGHTTLIADLWGKVYDINDIDIILTESQFKLWKGYDSWEQYVDKSREYGLGWGVTKFTHAKDDTYAFTNYQFLQVLDIDNEQIANLCQPTLNWLDDIMGGDVMKSILYMCGTDKEISIDTIHDKAILALIYNNDLIQDSYIKTKITRSINKKIQQAYSGKLIVGGNFSQMASDPYALLEYAFGMEVKGLLNDEEHYNGFWNDRLIKKVGACRSPLTHYSELNTLNFIKNEKTETWYKYLHNCITIYNIFGNDTMIHADSDFDGDIVFTTDQPEFIDGKVANQYPITFNKRPAEKRNITEKHLYDVDMMSFGSKIGFITNCSTAMYAMLPMYEKNSKEHNELLRRLKLCRKAQGEEIDKSKGIKIDKFPKSWTSRVFKDVDTGEKDDDGNIITKKEIDMSPIEEDLIITKKPYFQKYVYPKLNREYNEFKKNMEMYSYREYGLTIEENNDKEFLRMYNTYNPVLDTKSTMNEICHYLEDNIKEIKADRQKQDSFLIDGILIDCNRELLLEHEQLIRNCLKQYKQFRKNERDNISKDSELDKNRMSIFCKQIRKEVYDVIKNPIDIANIVVYVGYDSKVQENKDFVWNVFGKEVLDNVITNQQNKIYVPVKDKQDGTIQYLGEWYSKKEVHI